MWFPGSHERGVSGRELRIASIWTSTVYNSSKVRLQLPNTLCKFYLVDFAPASHRPPKCGEYANISGENENLYLH